MVNTATLEYVPSSTVIRPSYRYGYLSEIRYWCLAAICGATLALSAPGFDQWYLPWFGMIPLFLLTATAREPYWAGWRGFFFSVPYSLVYMHWYMQIRGCIWDNAVWVPPLLMSFLLWMLAALYQGLMCGIYCCVVRHLPLTAGWFPRRDNGKWLLPTFFVLPLFWVLFIDKLVNSPTSSLHGLGAPWCSFEYSQYLQPIVLQCTSVIGGIGLTFCILVANLTLLSIFAYRKPGPRWLSFSGPADFLRNIVVSATLLLLIPTYGVYRLSAEQATQKKMLTISAVQSNLTFEKHADTATVLIKHLELSAKCPRGMCVWPEWAVPVDVSNWTDTIRYLGTRAAALHQSWVMGAFDTNHSDKLYNAVIAVEKDGRVVPDIYRKRLPVPLGEAGPEWVNSSPILKAVLFHNRKRDQEITPFPRAVALKLDDAAVGPVLCFENMYPSLVADSVRAGAQILVDCSNTMWFHKSLVSDSLIAFSVLRAVENHRSFVFATYLGPSAIVDSTGHILKVAPREEEAHITAAVPVENDTTPFTRWCF